MIACARCGMPAPEGCPEPELIEGSGDEDVLVFPLPRNWFPVIDGPPSIVCVGCASDNEITDFVFGPGV